jgi:predicted nucleotidyltransferase component of viral defense system
MISKEEISEKAKELDIHVANVERDYVFGWLLKAIAEDPYLGQLLVLKGGNCFRKVYLPDTRFSEDLDFSTNQALNTDRFSASLASCCASIQAQTGVKFDETRNTIKEGRAIGLGGEIRQTIYKARVYFTDFFGEKSELTIAVRLDITEFDTIHLPTKFLPIVHPYSDSDICVGNIRCMSLEEMVASKMKCLLQRRHSHDFFDMAYSYVWRNELKLNRAEVISVFLRKTIFSPSPLSAKNILLGLPFEFFRSVWTKYIACPRATRVAFDDAATNFRAFVEELFAGAAGHYASALAFFPAELRNPIMDAARERKLVRLTYDGSQRLVEPYSLTFKRRKDGVAQEYFYCWDTTGGQSSGPGVKTLLNTKMSCAEVTDVAFEPRFEIELSKAGEAPKVTGFGGGRTASGQRVRHKKAPRRSRANPFSMTYVIQCPYCQKKFNRTKNDTALNPHKTPDGYPCRATRGYLLEIK